MLTGEWDLGGRAAVADELQGDADVLLLEQGDHGLQVVPLSAGRAELFDLAHDVERGCVGHDVSLLLRGMSDERMAALCVLGVTLPVCVGMRAYRYPCLRHRPSGGGTPWRIARAANGGGL